MNFKHGLSYTRFYKIYQGIEQRTQNNNSPSYHDYGGRGIKKKWASVTEFTRDMQESYLEHAQKYGEKNTYIERIDNDGDYCLDNCRWATFREQMNNKRSTVFYTAFGEKSTRSYLAEKYGVSYHVVKLRMRRGWDIERALTTPVRG